MNTRRRRWLPTLVAAAVTLTTLGVASAEEPVYEPATEQLFISAGCPQSTPGTCTSTRWLGLEKGNATSNFITSVTPVDEVRYRADGSLNWRDYASDDTLRAEGYPLRADQPLTQTVTVTSRGAAVSMTVHGRVEAFTQDGRSVTFGPLEKTVTMVGDSRQAIAF